MPRKHGIFEKLRVDIAVGVFLAKRELKRANKWTTALIVFVMLLTFLNLVVVSGILVGLIQGSLDQNKKFSSGDVIVSSFLNRNKVENSQETIKIVETIPGLRAYSARYTSGGSLQANYRDVLLKNEQPNSVGAQIIGVDPIKEDVVTNISSLLVEGSYLEPTDTDSIIAGSFLFRKYNENEFPGLTTLKDVPIGSRVLLKIGENSKEYTIKGILKSKVGEVDGAVFMLDSEFRKLTGRTDYNVNQIAISLVPGADPLVAKAALLEAGVGENGRVQTADEAIPQFLDQIKTTFSLLGNAISAIGLVVAAITIFIVIFVNAITRRRYIGILKGIGIEPRAIIISYIIQSLLYAVIGAVVGIIIVFAFLKPLFDVNPIDFPFSDGILVATVSGTATRTLILLIATIVAGYIPARIVIRQNTLSAILGR
ncbi:MAG: FtsX protein [Patescibacteria group bacterium]|nr:FtsX protein [Patescibacteria group bacterium]